MCRGLLVVLVSAKNSGDEFLVYLQGLAIEDCVQRSFAEWRRISPAA